MEPDKVWSRIEQRLYRNGGHHPGIRLHLLHRGQTQTGLQAGGTIWCKGSEQREKRGKSAGCLLHTRHGKWWTDEENGTEVLNNSFQLAINALTFDNTDLFYIDVTKINLLTEITTRAFSTTYRVKIGGNGQSYLADGFWDEEYVDIALGYIEDIKNNIISKTTGKDRVEQIKIVHDYLVDTVEYDLEAGSNIYNIYGTLIDKRAVCEGYARAFKYILDDLEIPTVIACGLAKNSAGVTETHAWNYVQLENGQWYAIDVTWDDPVIIGSGIISDSIKYQYFLKGANKFFEDHFEDGNIVGEADFEYPKLSVLDYYN